MYKRKKRVTKVRQFKLGQDYEVRWYNSSKVHSCRFIQPTRCGFNFLDLETNKCILKTHLYPSKYKDHKPGTFLINSYLIVKKK